MNLATKIGIGLTIIGVLLLLFAAVSVATAPNFCSPPFPPCPK